MSPYLSDASQFLRTLSVGKIVNILAVQLSYSISLLWKKPVVLGKPYSISVEPVDFCNLACPECPAGIGQLTRPRQSLDAGLFDKILDEAAPNLAYMMLYFQGEPYLHRNIFNLIQMSVQRGVYTAISTNAQLINDSYAEQTVRSGLHRIIISMDGITQETYEAYRRKGQLEKVLEGIASLRRWRKRLKSATPFIIVQFIVFRSNQHQLSDVRAFALAAGADRVEIKTAQLYDFENGNPLMTDIDRYSRYRKIGDGRYEVKSKLPNRCFRLWNGTVITAAGNVVPCCFDKDAAITMGNVASQPLSDIWKNKRYMQFRQNILRNRKNYNMCRNCTEK
ncbi:MAG: SPASM domain-containing protein [Bacteroidales bacterium]|jgi:radical SAM protein with 4Fe4S-binding SPASM domain|nr:SPASM domain-containing protein [Bacteroidales bacterium]